MLNIFSQGEKVNRQELFTGANSVPVRRAKTIVEDRLRRAAASATGTYSDVEVLTPELAELLLSRNTENRSIRPGRLRDIKADIREGRWTLNGEPIIVSKDGNLNDGQHRCLAVVETGRGIETVIVWGVGRDTRLTVDQGTNRTTGDYLAMEGVGDANVAAAVAGWLWQLQTHGRIAPSPEMRPTKTQVTEEFHATPAIIDSMRFVGKKGTALVGGRSLLVLAHLLLARVNPDAADEFIRSLLRPDKLSSSDPIAVCRDRLTGAVNKRLPVGTKLELIFRAWNMKRQGKRTSKIQLSGSLPKLVA